MSQVEKTDGQAILCHVLIPAFNEARYLPETIASLPQTLEDEQTAMRIKTQVLVIDDGSVDGSAEVAEAAGARVIRLAKNSGKGAALAAGFAYLEKNGVAADDLVLLLDADLGTSTEKVAALAEPILANQADLVIAQLASPPGSGGFGLVKNLGRKAIFELGYGFEAKAPLSGQRALRFGSISLIKPLASGYGVEVALTIRALQAGLRVMELPVAFRHRFSGRTLAGFIHRGKQYLDLRQTIKELRKG